MSLLSIFVSALLYGLLGVYVAQTQFEFQMLYAWVPFILVLLLVHHPGNRLFFGISMASYAFVAMCFLLASGLETWITAYMSFLPAISWLIWTIKVFVQQERARKRS